MRELAVGNASRNLGQTINLEKAANHGVHGERNEKIKANMGLSSHPLGGHEERPETQSFRRARCVRRG